MSLRQRYKLTGSVFSARVGQWTRRGIIKSIQQGSVATTAGTSTITINAVSTGDSVLLWSFDSTAIDDPQLAWPRIVFTNSTTITVTKTGADNGTVWVSVIEFVPGILKSVQRGTITLTSASGTATITAVNTAKSVVNFLGQILGDGHTRSWANVSLTNSTTVTGALGTFATNTTLGFEVWEFY